MGKKYKDIKASWENTNSNYSQKKTYKDIKASDYDFGVDDSYISSFVNDSQNYYTNMSDLAKDISYSNASQKYNDSHNSYMDLLNRSRTVRAYYNANKNTIGAENYNNMMNYLNSFDSDSEKAVKYFSDYNDLYSRFNSEDEYNTWYENLTKQPEQISSNVESNPYMEYDLDAMEEELKKFEEIESKTKGKLWRKEFRDLFASVGVTTNEEFNDKYSKKKAEYNVVKREQERTRLENDAVNASDFSEYAKIGSSIDSILNKKSQSASTFMGGGYAGDYDKYSTFMTDTEKNVYNYYLAKEKNGLIEKGSAQKYLDSVEATINQRKGTDTYETLLKDKTALELLFGVSAGLSQFASGMTNVGTMLFDESKESIAPTASQYTASMVREDLADNGFNTPLGSAGQIAFDLINTTSNMAPSILASMGANVILPGSGEIVGPALMGTSAAGNEYQNMLNQGYDRDASMNDAIITGLSEALLEKLLGGIGAFGKSGFSKFVGKELAPITQGIKSARLRILAEFGIDILGEAIEEGTQEILAPYIKAFATGEIAEDVDWENVIYSAILGGLSAGVLNAMSLPRAKYFPYDENAPRLETKDDNIEYRYGEPFDAPRLENKYNNINPTEKTNIYRPEYYKQLGQNYNAENAMPDVETAIDNSTSDLHKQVSALGFDEQTAKAIELGYDKELGLSVSEYVNGVKEGYNYGNVGIAKSDIRSDGLYANLPESVRNFAYSLGENNAKTVAETKDANLKNNFNGKTGKKVGTVKAVGVSLDDIKTQFNDKQNVAYKILSNIAEATGIDIVLYKSNPDENGKFTAPQGMFKGKGDDNAIYIDINAGLRNSSQINDLARYTMLRSFAHEDMHFAEKWNPKEYNTFRSLVFATLYERGQNAEDLIDTVMMKNPKLSYDNASREVVAEAMTDILGDERSAKAFGENLYAKDKHLFQKFVEALKEFIANLKSYFKGLAKNPSKAANALKEPIDGEIRYLDKILNAWVKLKTGAVENYQNTFAVDENTNDLVASDSGSSMNEIDVTALMNGITKAQGKANATGEEQSVKLSDYKKDNGSLKHIADMIVKNADASGNPPMFKPGILSIPHDHSTQEDNAINVAKENDYKLFFNVLHARKGMVQVDIYNNDGLPSDSIVINKFDDWDKVTNRIQREVDYEKSKQTKTEPDIVDTDNIDEDIVEDSKPSVVKSYEENKGKLIQEEYPYNNATLKERVKYDPSVPITDEEIKRIENALAFTDEDLETFIENSKKSSGAYAGGKERFNNWFSENHSLAETVSFLKKEFGESGGSGPGKIANYMSNGKGIRFNNSFVIGEHENGLLSILYGKDRFFSWNDIAKKYTEVYQKKNKTFSIVEGMTEAEKQEVIKAVSENMKPMPSMYPTQIVEDATPTKLAEEMANDIVPEVKTEEATEPSKFSATSEIARKIVKQAPKGSRFNVLTEKGMYFVGTTHVMARTDKATAEEVYKEKGYDAYTGSPSLIKVWAENSTNKLQGKAYKTELGGTKLFVFDDGKEIVAVNQKYFKYFAGYDYYYANPKSPIIVRDSNNEIVGAIGTYTKNDGKFDTSNLELAKIKGFNQEEKANGKDVNNKGTVQQSDTNGKRDAQLLEGLESETLQESGGKRGTVSNAEGQGGRVGEYADESNTTSGDSRSDGDSESGIPELTEEEQQTKDEELHEIVEEQKEEQSTVNPKGNNFVIDDSLDLPKGEKERFRTNVDAIILVKKLQAEGRYATPEEQKLLSKYVGWGGLANAFGETKYNYAKRKSELVAKKDWENEFDELNKLVSDGIISQSELDSMSSSTANAHFTSVEVIKAMYDGLAQLGFNGGAMLEPSCGVGNFVGCMPNDMSSKVKSWTMVELDSITGNIAHYLYPNNDVRIEGFEVAKIPDNYMDVAISNVPFGNYPIIDRNYPKRVTKSIHNYFFAKSLDKVRPGGIVMFITSSFTMNGKDDAIRQYIMDRADLIGAIRLPNTTFYENAGTQVVTDILVLKKREPNTEYAGETFLSTESTQIGEKYYQVADINEYFINHPEMALGKAVMKNGMYGQDSLTYEPLEGNLGEQIRNAFKNINVKMEYPTKLTPEKGNADVRKANSKTKNNGYVANSDGTISQNIDGNLEKVNVDSNTAKRIAGMLSIRDAYNELVSCMQEGKSDAEIDKARKALNTIYDKFVKENGYINSPKNKKAIISDPDKYSLYSLENYDSEKKTATKADIFTKNTISANKTVTHVDNIDEGLIVSINTYGGVNTEFISKLTGTTEKEVTRELIEQRKAFKTREGSLETPETYLSGNVRAKLKEAEELASLDDDFNNNVEELKRVIPKDIPYNDIYVTPGTPWIPAEVYADFIAETLGSRNYPDSYYGPDVIVSRINQSGSFEIKLNNSRLKTKFQNKQQYGTNRRTFLDLIEAMMNNRSIVVKDAIEDSYGKKTYVINEVETSAAQEKAEEITRLFQDWIWKNENRQKELSSLYNETFNAIATPKYNGEHLSINGINGKFSLRPHQSSAVQRIISSGGNTLLAHKVGAGKTLEMASAAMKLRQLGIVKKPMFAVPNSLVAQWGNEFKSYYPGAKLLVADEKSFDKDNRKTFANMIANGDYDAVIVSYEQFEKIPMSIDFRIKFYEEQKQEIISAIAEEKAENGKSISTKELSNLLKKIEAKIAELTRKAKDDDNIIFENLGVDGLFVDEAHSFKNLLYTTRMNNVAGLGSKDGVQRSFDLYTKVRYLQKLNGGRGIVFATATPVMNSMSEMYIMQKYLQSDTLKQLGIYSFDSWAKQFGEVVNALEIKPSGQGFRIKQTFSNFKNLNELQMLFRSFSDVLTDVPGLKIPKMKNGNVNIVECEPGEFQKDFMKKLELRANNIKNVSPKEDNMLKITSDGRKVSFTQKMIDPSLPYETGCKLYRCCDNVLEEYKNSTNKLVYDEKEDKEVKLLGTQIIFCDMATPKGKKKATNNSESDTDEELIDVESARLYEDMKAYLVKKGIPAKEIAFIHDADNKEKKTKLFADVNNGSVRVLIGSTGKMGVGMNAQKRIVAIHHLDAPWRPGDVEQRDGRAFRQGNINEEVSKYVYVTKGSFDARLWDILDRKQHFIGQIMNGENVGRTAEDTGEVTLSAAEVKALASGNPMIKEQVELTGEIKKLENLQEAFYNQRSRANAKVTQDTQDIASLESRIENGKADLSTRTNAYLDESFSMTIGNRTFTDKKEAGTFLLEAIVNKTDKNSDKFVKVGSFAGFDLLAIKSTDGIIGYVSGKQKYKFNIYLTNTTAMVSRVCEIVGEIDNYIKKWKTMLSEVKADLEAQEKFLSEPFAKQKELNEKRARFEEIMAILNPKEEQNLSSEEDDETQYQSRDFLIGDVPGLSFEEAQKFADMLGELNRDNIASKIKIKDGYIFILGNKLVYNNGDYDEPQVYKVIEINVEENRSIEGTNLDISQGVVIEYEKSRNTSVFDRTDYEAIRPYVIQAVGREVVIREKFLQNGGSYGNASKLGRKGRVWESANGYSDKIINGRRNNAEVSELSEKYQIALGLRNTPKGIKYLNDCVKKYAKICGYNYEAWHGTRNSFTVFDKSKRGSNTKTQISNQWFFAADKETANSYYPYGVIKNLEDNYPNMYPKGSADKLKNKGNLYHYYIKMENPLVIDIKDYDYKSHRENADAWIEFTKQAEDNGNDGIILLNAMDNQLNTGARKSTVYLFKNSKQAKSAEPITYDPNGNIIPLIERFDNSNEDTQYQSRDYLDEEDSEGRELSAGQSEYFAKSKNRDEKGNLKQMYHGTPRGGFTIFNPGYSDDNISLFFTDNRKVAKSYSGFDSTFGEKSDYTLEDLSAIYPVYLNCENPLIIDGKGSRWNEIDFDFSQGQMSEIMKQINALEKKYKMHEAESWSRGKWSSEDNNEYERLNNRYESLEKEIGKYDNSTRDIVKFAKEKGYDSVIFKNIYDIGSYGGDLYETSTVVAVFNSEQVKSVNNLNPTENPDIQMQERNEDTTPLTDTDILEMAANDLSDMNLTDGEKFALETMQKRLATLRDLQSERVEQGKLWKEQQFAEGGEREKAKETLNRIHILDDKIKKAENDVLDLEEKDVLKSVLKKARKVIEAKDKQKADDMLNRYRERKKTAESIKKYRDRITADVADLYSWINNPDVKKGKSVPDVLKNSIITFLSSIDFTSKRQLKGGKATIADANFVKNLEKLKGAIKKNIDVEGMYSGYNDLPETFMEDLQKFIDASRKIIEESNGEYVINQMTAEELKKLSKLVRVLKAFVSMMNNFHTNSMYKHVTDAGDNTLYELSKKGKASNVGELSNYVYWQQMRPAYAFERFGNGGKAIYKELVDGQAKLAFNAQRIIDFTNELYTDKEVKAWEEETKEFTIGGEKVTIPIAYIMGLYELSKQEDSYRHILSDKGGIRIATYKNGKTKFSDNGHLISPEQLEEILKTLTPRQKEVADKLQKFMATVGADWGNYVSVKRFGIEMFENPHYYPINSDGRVLDSTNDTEEFPSNASLYSLLNASFTKSRIEGSNNRIVIYSIFDVFANHMASMAQYNAFALPILDTLKWFNYRENWTDSEGHKVYGRSIKEELARVYGVPEESKPGKGNEGYAVSFIKNIIKAYNGTETQGNPQDGIAFTMLGKFNRAQIAYNVRVIVQQPMAILRAGLIVDYDSILKGMAMTPAELKATLEEMRENSGIYVWKSLGFYDVNVSRGLSATIKHSDTWVENVIETGLVGAELADKVTWAAIWNACKKEVIKKGTNPKDPKFLTKVGDLFDDIIYKTQVVDTVLTKNEFMRSKSFFAKAISSFMSEPVATASMLTDAMFNYKMDMQKGMSKQQAWQKNKSYIGKVAVVYAISQILLAAIQSVIDGLRNYDDDKSYGEKYLEAFIGNVIDELVPFNKLPIFSEVYDLLKEVLSAVGVNTYGNSPQTLMFQWADALVRGIKIIYDKINGSNSGYTWYAGVQKLLSAVSGAFGIPLASTTRELVTFWDMTAGNINSDLKVHTYVSGNHDMDKYFKAVDKGDYTKAYSIYDEVIEDKKKEIAKNRAKEDMTELSDSELEAKAKSSIKSSVTSHYKDEYVQAYKDNDTQKMAEIRKKLYYTDLYGSANDVIETCKKWLKEYN